MSSLTEFRDHCRAMANTKHRTSCTGQRETRWGVDNVHPNPLCGGCMPHVDRTRFAALADEIDDYLGLPTASVDLFGEVATEPADEPTHESEPV